jgi:hypothetical protein
MSSNLASVGIEHKGQDRERHNSRANMTTAEVMVQYLAAAGVRHIFGYPGDPNLDLI